MLLRGTPVNELGFGNREGQSFGSRNAAEGAVVTLKKLYVPSVREGRNCNHKVIDVRENQALRYAQMKGGNINNKQQRGDGGALWGTHGDWGESFWGALEEEPAFTVGEEATNPRNDVPVCPFGS